jgi:TetR/AcrR family transcriptional repressor of nem operon
MRVSRDEKDKTHARIVEGAARLLRERGLEAASVADVMREAGLTNGGFYRHFETKDELLKAALEAAFEECYLALESRFEKETPAAAAAGYRAHYLSDAHRDNPGYGCPVAALGGDVARATEALKKAFGTGVNRIITALAAGMRGGQREKRDRAARELAMLAGATMIARASDPETARAVLAACRSKSKGR